MHCPHCQKPLSLDPKISFREYCPFCMRDLHCCLACHFHDRGLSNECQETQAEPVLDKEKANYCEYFQFAKKNVSGQAIDQALKAKEKLAELFKRKEK